MLKRKKQKQKILEINNKTRMLPPQINFFKWLNLYKTRISEYLQNNDKENIARTLKMQYSKKNHRCKYLYTAEEVRKRTK